MDFFETRLLRVIHRLLDGGAKHPAGRTAGKVAQNGSVDLHKSGKMSRTSIIVVVDIFNFWLRIRPVQKYYSIFDSLLNLLWIFFYIKFAFGLVSSHTDNDVNSTEMTNCNSKPSRSLISPWATCSSCSTPTQCILPFMKYYLEHWRWVFKRKASWDSY